MPNDAKSAFQKELGVGEALLWCGKPRAGIRFRVSDIVMLPLSLAWCGFVFFWLKIVAEKTKNDPFFVFLGVPFILIALYLLIGRLLVDATQRAATSYGLTGERILILSGLFRQKLLAVYLRELEDFSLTRNKDGSGTIFFRPARPVEPWLKPWSSWAANTTLSFDSIENADEVCENIRALKKETG